jgi:hypothetical protein
MKWFTQISTATIEPPPPLTAAQRLTLVNAEYRAAEKAYNEACKNLQTYLAAHPDRVSLRENRVFVGVNCMHTQPIERKRLETIRREKLATRNDLLAERAVLLTQGVHHET